MVRKLVVGRERREAADPGAKTTKQKHERLLRALADRRLKRAFGG